MDENSEFCCLFLTNMRLPRALALSEMCNGYEGVRLGPSQKGGLRVLHQRGRGVTPEFKKN